MNLDTHQSSYREKLLEHLFVGDLLRYAWLHKNAALEVAGPEVDRAGYDVILEADGAIRHVQLKSSSILASTASQKIHIDLGRKPSGCIVWLHFDPENLELGPFRFYGGQPGKPLPPLDGFKVARHVKGNAAGYKAERPHIRVIPKGKFEVLKTIPEIYQRLFGNVAGVGGTGG